MQHFILLASLFWNRAPGSWIWRLPTPNLKKNLRGTNCTGLVPITDSTISVPLPLTSFSTEWSPTTHSSRSTAGTSNEIVHISIRRTASTNSFSFNRNYYKGSEYALNLNECDAKCRADLLCRIVTTNIGDDSHCANVYRRILSHQEF